MNDSLKILDLGCGKRKVPGAIGVDRVKVDGVDIVHDLTKFPYPFEDESVDKIYCRHILEHFDVDTRNRAIGELYRILKTRGELEIRVPHAFCIGAYKDPTHKSFFTFETMVYFTTGHFFSYYSKIRFEIIKKWSNVNIFHDWATPSKLKRNLFFKNLVNGFLNNIMILSAKISNVLPDYIVKVLPLYDVEIIWVLRKGDK